MKKRFKPRYDLAKKRLRAEYKLAQQSGKLPAHNQVPLLYAIGTNFVNSVLFKNPYINFKARNEQETEEVENVEIKVNDFLKDKKSKKKTRRGAWDGYLAGFMCFYTDWVYEDVDTGEPMMQTVNSIDEFGNPTQVEQPIIGEDGKPQTKREIIKNEPMLERIAPNLVRFPRGFDFDTPEDSPWVGFESVVTLEEARKDPKLDQEITAGLEGTAYSALVDKEAYTDNDRSEDMKFVKLFYIFYKSDNPRIPYSLKILCDEKKDKVLHDQPFKKGHVGSPLKFAHWNPLDDDDPYPMGDAWMMESQFAAIDRWWRTYLNHVKRISPKNIYNKRFVTPKEIQKLKSNEDEEWAGVGESNKDGLPLEKLIHRFQHSPVHQDMTIFSQFAEKVLNRVSPRTSLSLGEGKSIDTATEANIIQQGELSDLDARVEILVELFKEIGLDLAGLFQNSLQGVTKVEGELPTGEKISRETDKSGFTTNLDMDVNVETMQSQNREIFKRQLIDEIITIDTVIKPALKESNKTIKMEFFAKKYFENIGIRNADQAIVDAGLRDASREHEDLAMKGIPIEVQEGEDMEKHLVDHFQTLRDPEKMKKYEQLRPGFEKELLGHTVATSERLAAQKNEQPNQPKSPVSGQRDQFATELSRS